MSTENSTHVNSPPYAPVPGSLAWRVCNWFGMSRNRAEERTAQELAHQFEAKRTAVITDLGPAVAAGLLTWEQGERQWVYKTGAALDAWVRGSNAPPAAKPRGGRRPRLPPLNVAALAVRTDVPIPKARTAKGFSIYTEALDKLDKVGSSIEVPIQYRQAISKTLTAYAKRTQRKFTTRVVGIDKFGIWRTA